MVASDLEINIMILISYNLARDMQSFKTTGFGELRGQQIPDDEQSRLV
jgi:hypothetical protein